MTAENVVILFTDIVGSTGLSPAEADQVRRGHFSILRQAVTEAGGTEVKNLGDGLMVAFSSASAALDCGVAMQQGVERDNRGQAHPLGLRVGLSGGEVTREEDDYFGDPVIEAARLCARCQGGQVLAADVVRAMAGRRSRHRCRPLGELALKGLPDPVEVVEVPWEPLPGGGTGMSVPLPGRLTGRPAVGVVGRAPELATIADAAKSVAAGEGHRILLVSGEAGLGKSTLVGEASRLAFDGGACVLFGHCEEDLATPYQLFAEALGHLVTHAPEEQLLAHVEAHGSELAHLVPALAGRIPDLPPSRADDADTERFLLFASVVGLLAAVSEAQPVVLVLDDLQWADKGSLLLLRHLVSAEQGMRVLILGTYRDSELSQTHPLTDTLAALHRQRQVFRIDLAGLDDLGVLSLVEAAAGQALDDAGVRLAHAVYRETDGNPFFVSEMLRHLSETGAIYQDADGRWMADATLEEMQLPESVRVVIGARVGRLGADAGRVLSVASVIGRDFDLDLLARATDTAEDDLLDILEAAAAVSLVREPSDAASGYNFAHALIQHTLYQDMGASRRARAHRLVAEALEELCGDRPGKRVGELARHWMRATQPIEVGKAIDYSRRAGDAALESLAPADALRYYAQAIDLARQVADPDPTLGLDLAIGLGMAQAQTGDPSFRETLLGAARRAADLGDTVRLVNAALATNRGIFSAAGVVDGEKVEVLELALDQLPEDDPARALVLAALSSELTFDSLLERRKALADEALELAVASGDDATIVRVTNSVVLSLDSPSLLGESLARTADALARAERLGDPVLHFWAADLRAIAAGHAGDIAELDRCIGIAGGLARTLDQPTLNWEFQFLPTLRAMIEGDADLVEQLATDGLTVGTDSGQPDAAVLFGAQLMTVHYMRGTVTDLLPVIEQLVADNPGLPAFAASLARVYVEDGPSDEAMGLLEQLATAGFDLPEDGLWMIAMASYADAAIECRLPKYAGPIFDRLLPYADQLSVSASVATSGPVTHYLGGLATVLGRFDEADDFLTRAAGFSARVGARYFAARTNLLAGRMRLDRRGPGDTGLARELLSTAHSAAVSHGYGTVERRAAAALERLG